MKLLNIILISLCFLPNLTFGQEKLNQFDEGKKYHGKWIKYYPNTKVKRYEGNFIHGKPSGEFIYYYDTGNIRTKMNYEDSGKVAYTISYFDNGSVYAEGKYVNKQKEGVWKFYDGYGNIISTQEYSKDAKHGQELTFLQNGIILEEKEYSEGVLDGIWKRNYANGEPHFIGSFKNNTWSGEFTFYHLNGKKSVNGFYENSLKENEWKYWDTNGILIKIVMFKKGHILNNKVFQQEKDQDWIDKQDIENIMQIMKTKESEKSTIEFPYQY